MYAASLTLHDFVERYTRATDAGMSERATAQSHFIDLCATIGKKTPLEEDPAGEWYAFEKGVDKLGGGKGFADVWRKSCFAWEYKRGNGDLAQAYVQLSRYREALLNPPLLVTCDLRRFQVHTNFTDSVKRTYDFTLTDLVRNDATETCARRPARSSIACSTPRSSCARIARRSRSRAKWPSGFLGSPSPSSGGGTTRTRRRDF